MSANRALRIFCWFASPPEVRAKSPVALAPSRWMIASTAVAFSAAVSSFVDFLWVSASASCSTRAAEMFGTSRCSESYSPRNAAEIMSDTSAVGRLLNDPRSAESCTTFSDMSADCLPANPNWVNMFPNPAAASNACCRDRPRFFAAPFAHRSISPAFLPKMTFDLLTVSFRALAPSIMLLNRAMPPTATAAPAAFANAPPHLEPVFFADADGSAFDTCLFRSVLNVDVSGRIRTNASASAAISPTLSMASSSDSCGPSGAYRSPSNLSLSACSSPGDQPRVHDVQDLPRAQAPARRISSSTDIRSAAPAGTRGADARRPSSSAKLAAHHPRRRSAAG